MSKDQLEALKEEIQQHLALAPVNAGRLKLTNHEKDKHRLKRCPPG
jgi:hypothetical protein